MKLTTFLKEGESIDKALKKYKKKIEKIHLLKEIRDRKYYIKPSSIRRSEINRAKYREYLRCKREE
ncbi:MAG TPA: 30S ribosomal protein S21 [Blattabacteriaceae bacterium]